VDRDVVDRDSVVRDSVEHDGVDRDEVAAAIVLYETPRQPGVPALRARILKHGSSLSALAAARSDDAARRRWDDGGVRAEAQARAARLIAGGGRFLLLGDPKFPARLAGLEWGPPWLFVRGEAPSIPELAAAIVGTRRATPSACEIAHDLAAGVARTGVAVVSGLARGIDAAAHRGALHAAADRGELGALDTPAVTLAVLGTGVDQCYPAAHRGLFAEILAHGLVISELPPGTPPLPYHFPMRNRILAGLCQAVVVVQAPERSGALVTAAHAAESGSEVLAVPGDPLIPENAGSNRLLAAGARVALGVEDVLSAVHGHEVVVPGAAPPFGSSGTALGSSATAATLAIPEALAPRDRALLAALDFTPRDVDELVRTTGFEVEDVLSGLLRLELAGWVESVAGGRVRWTPQAARSRQSN